MNHAINNIYRDLSMLAHEKFKPYILSIEFLEFSLKLQDLIPRGNSVIKDQLKRASLSIPLNIAEGTGKIYDKDRKYFYAIARGSAMECAAILDVIVLLNREKKNDIIKSKDLLVSIISILSKICLK